MDTIKVSVVSKSDEFDLTEFMTCLVRLDEIEVSSVDDIVEKVSRRCIAREAMLERLDIFAHGKAGIFHIGDDWIGSVHAPGDDPLITFGGLQTFFSDDGIIVLCVCEAGQNDATLLKFSRIVGVPVYATTGDVSPNMSVSNFGWWWGPTVVAFSDGTIQRGTSVRIPVDPWEGAQS